MLPQPSWSPNVYPKPSHIVKFWSQLNNWGLRYWAASVYKIFFFGGYMASNIMESQNVSKTFQYGEVLVSIDQLGPEIWNRNSSWTLKIYPKPSCMVKFLFQWVNYGQKPLFTYITLAR